MSQGDRAHRVEALFGAALERPPAERARFLEQACAPDDSLYRELLELIAHGEAEGDFLASPALRPLEPELDELFGIAHTSIDEPLPQTIGGCQVLGILGRGATGVVYEARQRQPSRPVAVKLLHPGPVTSAVLARFAAEVRTLARLDHPNIAGLYEAGTEEIRGAGGMVSRLFFLVMEIVPGQRLDRWADEPDRSLAELLETFAGICDAVAHAHRRGVLHRDLKPANILVTTQGQPKVIDFGIARSAAAAGGPGECPSLTRQTATGQVLGSLAYMSPEQVRDSRRVGPASDVYSLGVVLYRMLTGRLPVELEGLDLAGAAAAIETLSPLPLRRIDPALGGELEALVETAMAKSPSRRYACTADFAADVRRYLAHQPVRWRRRGWRNWVRGWIDGLRLNG